MAEQQHTDSDKDSAACRTSGPGRPKIASIVVFDTEASGLPSPGRSTKITELCLLSVLTDEIRTPERLPRVMNKLQLCFNPKQCIEPSASRVTGLYNDVLEHMPTFQEQASLIASFLISQPSPTCIIAHNGHEFDFPLLMQELEKAGVSLPEGTAIYCADSLEAFRMLDGLPAKPEWLQKKAQKACEEVEKKVLMEDLKKETFSGESGSSECSAEPCHSQWSQNETTPSKVASTSEIPRTDFSKQLRKRHKGLPNEGVRKQESKVARRLFDDNSEKAKTESEGFSATVDHEISSDESETEHNSSLLMSYSEVQSSSALQSKPSDAEDPWHGSTPDEEFVALAVEAEAVNLCKERVTSLGSETGEGSQSSARNRTFLGKEAFEGDANKSQSISFVPHEDPGTQQVVINSETKNDKPPDSLVKIRKSNYWNKKPTVSYKLGEIYWRVFKEYPGQAHTAEGDCLTLLKLIHNKAPQFLAWLEENVVLLSSHSCTLRV